MVGSGVKVFKRIKIMIPNWTDKFSANTALTFSHADTGSSSPELVRVLFLPLREEERNRHGCCHCEEAPVGSSLERLPKKNDEEHGVYTVATVVEQLPKWAGRAGAPSLFAVACIKSLIEEHTDHRVNRHPGWYSLRHGRIMDQN